MSRKSIFKKKNKKKRLIDRENMTLMTWIHYCVILINQLWKENIINFKLVFSTEKIVQA